MPLNPTLCIGESHNSGIYWYKNFSSRSCFCGPMVRSQYPYSMITWAFTNLQQFHPSRHMSSKVEVRVRFTAVATPNSFLRFVLFIKLNGFVFLGNLCALAPSKGGAHGIDKLLAGSRALEVGVQITSWMKWNISQSRTTNKGRLPKHL